MEKTESRACINEAVKVLGVEGVVRLFDSMLCMVSNPTVGLRAVAEQCADNITATTVEKIELVPVDAVVNPRYDVSRPFPRTNMVEVEDSVKAALKHRWRSIRNLSETLKHSPRAITHVVDSLDMDDCLVRRKYKRGYQYKLA